MFAEFNFYAARLMRCSMEMRASKVGLDSCRGTDGG
jgi:hypothetical protein